MAGAFILLEAGEHPATLEALREQLASLAVTSSIGEWRFLDHSVPQLELSVDPPIALQLTTDGALVREETLELLDSDDFVTYPRQQSGLERCDTRIEVVSGQQPHITHLAQGGILTSTPEPDLTQEATRDLLRRLAERLHGWLWFNE